MLDPSVDRTFAHEYEVAQLTELPPGPSTVPVVYLPMNRTHNTDGVMVEISPNSAEPWIGVFAFGYGLARTAISAISTCPDEYSICVVANGSAYVTDSRRPSSCVTVPCVPVFGVRSVARADLLVFWDFTSIVAWGRQGLAWKSKDLCSDDLEVGEVTGKSIKCTGWSAPSRSKIAFELDLFTGTTTVLRA
jgi:hypothetical protein